MNAWKVAFLLLLPLGASAQGLIAGDEPTCYSWNGGNFSAGSFSKCGPRWVALAPKPQVVAAAAPVIQPSPIMMPMSCPPPTSSPVVKRKPKPVSKKC